MHSIARKYFYGYMMVYVYENKPKTIRVSRDGVRVLTSMRTRRVGDGDSTRRMRQSEM
jgi:hypothetical protein